MAHDELLPMTMIMINNGIVIMNHKAIIMTFGKIDPMSLGVSLGILSGVSTIFMGLILLIFNTGKPFNGTIHYLRLYFASMFVRWRSRSCKYIHWQLYYCLDLQSIEKQIKQLIRPGYTRGYDVL